MNTRTPEEALSLFKEWVSKVNYPGYDIEIEQRSGMLYMQATWFQKCSYTGKLEVQSSRQWTLHPQMTKNEIVQTALKLCLTAAEHEVRENFTYADRKIFGPHFDVDALVDLCDKHGVDYRGKKTSAHG